MSVWNRVIHGLAVFCVGEPPPRTPPGVRTAKDAVNRWPAFVPPENPVDTGLRQQDALSLVDEDCYGYLLLTVRKEAVGPRARIQLAEQLDPSWWPAIGRACEAIAAEAKAQT